MTQEETFMTRAMELARLGIGSVSPNPRVGCVIVHDGRIVGEGWHKRYGEAHAEVNAIESVIDKSILSSSTAYVNLEPCSHHGKTPPCADLLISMKIQKVIIANVDTNPLVGGAGIHKLRDAGIEVVTGVLEKEGRELNKRFFTFIGEKRPYIILKWAETSDGFIAKADGDSKWISNAYSRQLVHRWRTEEDAVLVGTHTAERDDPRLNVRDWSGRDPVRIVIDRKLRLERKLKIFDETQKTLCYNLLKTEEREKLSFVKIAEDNFLNELIGDLYNKKIQSLIVEGGAKTLGLFIEAGFWDEARIFRVKRTFGAGMASPKLSGILSEEMQLGEDELLLYERR